MSKTERFRLYAAAFNMETAEIALNEPYSKASKTHILVYKRGRCPKGYKEITDEIIYLLPVSDREWLSEVNQVIMQRFLLEHRAEEEAANKKFLAEFERELEIERQRLSQSSESSEQGVVTDAGDERVQQL